MAPGTGRLAIEARGRLAQWLRRPRRVETLAFRDVGAYDELLSARTPSILELHAPATLPANGELLFPELANEEIRREHFRVHPEPAGVGLAHLRDVLVSGASLIGDPLTLYRLGPLVPLYVDQHLTADHPSNEAPVGDRRLYRKTRRVVSELCVLLTHCNSAVYGHWLLESMPKLLLLRRIADRLPAFRIVLPKSSPEWIVGWIKLVLPHAALEIYNDRKEYLHCRTLLAPTLLMHPEHFFHPELRALLETLRRSVTGLEPPRRKLYLSRTAPSRFRALSNQREIEDIALDEGLSIVNPESFSIEQQIALFAGAELIVGEFGSGMHNALFSPPEAKVLCLNWINGMQSRIAQLTRHEVGYLPPSDGALVKYVKGAPPLDYHIDPRAFRSRLRSLL